MRGFKSSLWYGLTTVLCLIGLTGCSDWSQIGNASNQSAGDNTSSVSTGIVDVSKSTLRIENFTVSQVGGATNAIFGTATLENDTNNPIRVPYDDFVLQSSSGIDTWHGPSFENGQSEIVPPNSKKDISLEFDYSDPSTLGQSDKLVLKDSVGVISSFDVAMPQEGYGTQSDSQNTTSSDDSSTSLQPEGLTMASFEQINSTYTLDMVNQLFGFPGTLDSDVGAGTGYELTMYHWEDGFGDIVTIQFQNGYEDAKSQIGLQ